MYIAIKFKSQRRDVQSRSDQGMEHLVFEVEATELIWKTETGFGGERSNICKDAKVIASLLRHDDLGVGSKYLIWLELKLFIALVREETDIMKTTTKPSIRGWQSSYGDKFKCVKSSEKINMWLSINEY